MTQLIENIAQVVGPRGLILGDDVAARSDQWPPEGGCRATAIIRPADTAEVAAVMRLCHEARQPVVAHGGLTGLVRGARTEPGDVVLSLERMNAIEAVDAVNRTLIAQAGAPLQRVQEAARDAGLLFPLDLGARGTATIGGNISTNAGGNAVIRYGMTREQVLGLEAVLADGTVVSSMKGVIKNNTGYDLKQLFIGSEGTLGIVTRAVLRLRPVPRSRQTALVAVPSYRQVTELLAEMDTALGGTLSAFEVMWQEFLALVMRDPQSHGRPVSPDHPFYVLIEATGGHEESDRRQFEDALERVFEAGLVVDAALAQSQQQRESLWAIRDDIEAFFRLPPPVLTFDVSLGIADMAAYVDEVRADLQQSYPELELISFGHLGDGNIHLVVSTGSTDPGAVRRVEEVVYGRLAPLNGIISAEHGIGLDKRAYLHHSRSPEELALMRTLKRALDPHGLLNPGKILPQ